LEAELALPPFPIELAYLWSAFMRLRRRSAGGLNGPEPVTLQAIETLSRLSCLRFAPWEIKLIEALDDLYLVSVSKPSGDTGSGKEG